MSENPYLPPRTELGSGIQIGAAEMAGFAGESAAYYGEQVRRLLSRRRVAFNLSAFFFGHLWCWYRRLYVVGMGLILAEAVVAVPIGFGVESLAPSLAHREQAVLTGLAASVVVKMPFAAFANLIYVRVGEKALAKARSRVRSEGEIAVVLARDGGTSGWALAGGIALNVALNLVTRSLV